MLPAADVLLPFFILTKQTSHSAADVPETLRGPRPCCFSLFFTFQTSIIRSEGRMSQPADGLRPYTAQSCTSVG